MMRLAAEAFETPLMIDARKATTIATVFGPRLLGSSAVVIDHEGVEHSIHRQHAGVVGEPVRRVLEKREMFGFMRVGAVGIIPIEGTLVRKGAFLGQSSGETSYEGLSAQVARAMDPAVRGVAFEVDSFGGMANGAFALADQIHELSQAKPTIAILTDFAMSAAYLLASQCRQIVMPRQGAAGSIGVITMHVDRSAAVEQSGLKVTVVKSGAKKDQGSSLGPLADDYLARLQASVDATRDEFAAVVARGRGARLTKAAALATEADWFEGETAVAAGLVDHIADPQRAFEAFAAAIHAANPGA